MSVQIQLRRDTAANWTSVDPTLAEGEIGVETDTLQFKIGDGSTAWTLLAYAGGGGAVAAEDVTIVDAANDFTATNVEDALAELQSDAEAHVAAVDPHTGYRREDEDHSHASSGAQGGQVAHSVLSGVGADDHHARSHDHASAGDGTSLSPATLVVPASASPAQTAEGSAVWDSDDDVLTIGDGASRKTFGKLGATTGSAVGTAAAGTSVEASRVDHVHPTGAGTPSTQAFGDAASTGSGPAAAMTDHKHAMPADPVTAHAAAADPHTGYVLESLLDAKGDLIAASADNTPAKVTVGANDTILMADSAQAAGLKWVASQTPSTQAFGDAAAEGTADTYARGDHKHAIPANPVTAHESDTSDAHDASAISIADAGGYFTGTDVEAALQEIGAHTHPYGFDYFRRGEPF